MGLIDSHAHLTFPQLCGRMDEILERCAASGVDCIITVGTTLADSRQAVDLARLHRMHIHAAGGIHPHEAEQVTEADLDTLGELWADPAVVGVGEIGLDYHYDFADRAVQRSVFGRQLELAGPRDLPLIIHCRKAIDDTVSLLLNHGFAHRRVVFHCFTGTEKEASRLAECGWRISFAGIVTFRKSTWLQEIAKAYPAEKLMVETDSPYLSPVPVRGKTPNEPAYLTHTARFLADLRGESFEALVEQTAGNTRLFFDL